MLSFYLILITVLLLGITVLKAILKLKNTKLSAQSSKKNQERELSFVFDDFESNYEDLMDKANILFLHSLFHFSQKVHIFTFFQVILGKVKSMQKPGTEYLGYLIL